jgi:integrase
MEAAMTRPRKPPAKIDTKTARAKLAAQDKPYYNDAARGCDLGYRRPRTGPGSWYVRHLNGENGYWLKRFATADDSEQADGVHVLSYAQALDLARKIARGEAGDDGVDSDRPLTVDGAVEQYRRDLQARGGHQSNATWIKRHMPPKLGTKILAMTSAKDWRQFRDGLVSGGTIEPSTVNRIMKATKAMCSLAGRLDQRIAANAEAWRRGLEMLPNADRTRVGVILDNDTIRTIVAGVAAVVSEPVALFVEILAQSGARHSQVSQLDVGDVIDNDRLALPASRKGSSARKVDRRPVPIGRGLWQRLRAAAGDRDGDEPLLHVDGRRIKGANYREQFRTVVAGLGLDGAVVTPYCLRHSAIVRALLANVPVRIVAAGADTSVTYIERNYARYVSDHADTVARRGLIDFASEDSSDNVIPLPRPR